MYRKQVRRRRAILVALIVTSLVLLSAHFSEAESGPLHAIQRGATSVHEPEVLEDESGKVVQAAIATYGETLHTFIDRSGYKGTGDWTATYFTQS